MDNDVTLFYKQPASIDITITDSTGAVYTQDGSDTVIFTMKQWTDRTVIVLQKTIIKGRLELTAQDTDIIPGTYVYDIQMTAIDGYTATIVEPSPIRIERRNSTQILIDAICLSLRSTGHKAYENEVKQGLQDNSFLVNLINSTYNYINDMRRRGTFSFDVLYFTHSKREGYTMGEELMRKLEMVNTVEGMLRGGNMSYRYVDGVLHFYVSYRVELVREPEIDYLMHRLRIKGNIKNG